MAGRRGRLPLQPSLGGARMFFHDHRRALLYAFLMLLAMSLLFVVVAIDPRHPIVQPVDDWWYRAMNELHAPAVAFIARVFDVVGARGNIPIRIGVALVLLYRRNWPALAVWLLTWAFSEIAINVAKSSIGRPRPPEQLVRTTTSSFPSGHATAGAATAVALVLVLLPPGRRRERWEWIAVAITFLMGPFADLSQRALAHRHDRRQPSRLRHRRRIRRSGRGMDRAQDAQAGKVGAVPQLVARRTSARGRSSPAAPRTGRARPAGSYGAAGARMTCGRPFAPSSR